MEMFREHFVQVDSVLRAMSNRGLLVDRERRSESREKFRQRLKETIERAQPYMPLDKRPYKAYTYDEDRLKRQGLWEEGRMIVVKAGAEVKDGWEVKEGWLRKIPKPKKEKKKNAKAATRRRARGEGAVSS
jgi:hypothetical protein